MRSSSSARKSLFFILPVLIFQLPALFSAGEINILSVSVEQKASDRYEISGQITNQSAEPREIILRAQLTFYDRTAPVGDKPLTILRRDIQQILKPGETRNIRVALINEGADERNSVRLVPLLRVRRNRIWNY